MKAPVSARLILVGTFAVVFAFAARADDPAKVDDARQERRKLQFQDSLSWYRVTSKPNGEVAMKPRPVLRWTNAARKQEGEPTLILWIDAGRPEALASVYSWSGNLIYECASLAREPGLTVHDRGRVAWSPADVGISLQDVPDAPVLAGNPAARLTQMKTIAERFKVTMKGIKADLSDREELRLLPKSIYRYEVAEARAAHPDLIDGAVFAFVQGTDPEAVLLVEAVRRGDRTGWQFALARATSAGLEAKLGSTIVWTAPRATVWDNPKLPEIGIGRPLVE